MSHFTVLVIGPNVDEQLAPYHEFECTGDDNAYVQDIDITDECRSGWQANLAEYPNFLDYCKEYEGKTPLVVGAPKTDEHKYGYALVDASGVVQQVVRRTNLSAHWDWYTIGGRWTGFFKLKPGAEGELGRPGLMTTPARPGYADQACVRDIDFQAMRDEAAAEALSRYDRAHAVLQGKEVLPWALVRAQYAPDLDAARRVYNGQPGVVALRNSGDDELRFTQSPERFMLPRDEFEAQARAGAVSTYAVVQDGVWHGKGEMGWFGMSSNEGDEAEWQRQFAERLDALPDDTLLTVVDCHI